LLLYVLKGAEWWDRLDDGRQMRREFHGQFCESLGLTFPKPNCQADPVSTY